MTLAAIGQPVSPDSDKDSLLVGWAGWDHKDQATR
jgi:hypothetical protein